MRVVPVLASFNHFLFFCDFLLGLLGSILAQAAVEIGGV